MQSSHKDSSASSPPYPRKVSPSKAVRPHGPSSGGGNEGGGGCNTVQMHKNPFEWLGSHLVSVAGAPLLHRMTPGPKKDAGVLTMQWPGSTSGSDGAVLLDVKYVVG